MAKECAVDSIIGGLTTSSETLKIGSKEYVVGECSKWHLRSKFIKYKYVSTSKIKSEKQLLKILGLSIPVSFNSRVFYDDGKSVPIVKDKHRQDKEIDLLKKKLEESHYKYVDDAVKNYNLRAPLVWALIDLTMLLIKVNKMKRPNMRKIHITGKLTQLFEKVWRGRSYFRMNVNSQEVPADMITLVQKLLGELKKNNYPKGKWIDPEISLIVKPELCVHMNAKRDDEIKNIKQKMKSNINAYKKDDIHFHTIKEYVNAILMREKLYIDHVEEVEKYYIALAKNIIKITKSIKKYFSV